jgi:hypothetical protein
MGSIMQMMGGKMLVSGSVPYNPNGSLVSLEQASDIAKGYLAAQNNPDLALAKKKGVNSAKVSLNERMAVVEYDPAILAVSDIAKTVNDLGYIATARR